MNKEELQKELSYHQHQAGQAALRVYELEEELRVNRDKLAKETGAVLILQGVIKDFKDVTSTAPDSKS